MEAYKIKIRSIPGTDFREVNKKASSYYKEIIRKSKRRPYVRSIYFKKTKIFLGLFWQHLYSKKNFKDQVRRMKFFPCAIELIKFSHLIPESKENPNKKSEILHRFTGITKEKEIFFVQIKEDKASGEKFLISVFPLK